MEMYGIYRNSFVTIQTETEKMGLTIDVEKAKFMIISSQQTDNSPLVVNGFIFENVTEFKYLVTTVTNRNKINDEIDNQLI